MMFIRLLSDNAHIHVLLLFCQSSQSKIFSSKFGFDFLGDFNRRRFLR